VTKTAGKRIEKDQWNRVENRDIDLHSYSQEQ
jgi:hypothetical protein